LLFAGAADMLGGVSHGHPGFLGYRSSGVVAIHADWPMYAAQHDWPTAPIGLGSFPTGTTFSLLDDIDQASCCWPTTSARTTTDSLNATSTWRYGTPTS
jgi:hypothetical protein